MNERLKELIEQSGFGSYAEIPDTYIVHKNDLAEFAELIVKEAGAYLMSPEFIGRSDLDWSIMLNEHFGVE
jgi:hypothetical protein